MKTMNDDHVTGRLVTRGWSLFFTAAALGVALSCGAGDSPNEPGGQGGDAPATGGNDARPDAARAGVSGRGGSSSSAADGAGGSSGSTAGREGSAGSSGSASAGQPEASVANGDAAPTPEAGGASQIDATLDSRDTSAGGGDDMAVAMVLNKYQMLDPCDLSSYTIESSPGAVCPQTNAVKNQHLTLKFAGDAAITYNVTLRVRGIIEHYWYAGGQLDPVNKTFYTGGVPTVGGFSSACKNTADTLPFKLPAELTPTDNCFNGFNVFAMAVSAPKQHYYLNYTADKQGDRQPHAVYKDDYTVTIPIAGQAALDFYVIGSDEHECYNHTTVVSGVNLPMSPYVGEFVQFDVVNVSRAP